ncbi:MAG: helix-turn-helix domain-containing protein [Proteobacteria bacterium]|nr:helix-turn-helix domain-containing protein [Pseudomonadota bacterium]
MKNHTTVIQNLVNHIEFNLCEEINIEALSQNSGLSPWHFQRLFKSLVGDTLGGYLRGRRLTKAAQLLLESKQGILDIAMDVGFQSHEAFSRSFKKNFKASPKNFRQQRPKVILSQKPIITPELLDHLRLDLKLSPEIIQWPAQKLVGFPTTIPSPFSIEGPYCDLLFNSWGPLITRQSEINNRASNNCYGLTISPSGNYTETELEFVAGTPVLDWTDVPEGMGSYEIPSQLVARFDVYDVSADTVSKTMDYIYGYWLPNSEYERGMGNDYEFFEQILSFDEPVSGSKYVIPIKKQ